MPSKDIFRTWTVGRDAARVECSLDVLSQISDAALEGFRRFRHGGVEIGGVLLGSARNGAVRITAALPLDIEYARGASFLLTDADDQALRRLANGRGVVGFYESRTRRGPAESGFETYDRLFPEPSTVCIVLKPESAGETTTAVYFREESGNAIEAVLQGDAVEERVEEIQTAPIVAQPPPRPTPPTAYDVAYEPHAKKGRPWLYAIPVVASVALCAGLLLWPTSAKAPIPSVPVLPPPTAPASEPPPLAQAPEEAPVVKAATKKKRVRRARQRRARARTAPAAAAPTNRQ